MGKDAAAVEPIDRTDPDGTWRSPDGGVTWHLVEPSDEFKTQAEQDAQAAAVAEQARKDADVKAKALRTGLAQLLRDRDAAKATIAAGRAALTPVRNRAAQPASAAGLLQVQNDLKTVANALDGLANIDLGIIDYVAALAELTVDEALND